MKNVVRQTVFLFAVILLCAAGFAHSAGVDVKEGEWELSTESSMTMGAMAMPPTAGLQDICAIRSRFMVSSAARRPRRAAARAASQPA